MNDYEIILIVIHFILSISAIIQVKTSSTIEKIKYVYLKLYPLRRIVHYVLLSPDLIKSFSRIWINKNIAMQILKTIIYKNADEFVLFYIQRPSIKNFLSEDFKNKIITFFNDVIEEMSKISDTDTTIIHKYKLSFIEDVKSPNSFVNWLCKYSILHLRHGSANNLRRYSII